MYPKFKALVLKDKNLIESFTGKFRVYCDFNFASLINWSSPANPTKYSILNDNLILKLSDFTSNKQLVTCLGNNRLEKTAYQLLDKYKELSLIPKECVTQKMQHDTNLLIEEDIDNHEYILSIADVSKLSGKKLKSKRLYTNRFKRMYPNHIVKRLNIFDNNVQKEIVDLYWLWKKLKTNAETFETNNFEKELMAIKRLLKNAKYYDEIIAIGIYVEDKMVAFTTNQASRNGTAIGSFGKADYRLPGVYAYLEHVTAKFLGTLGYIYLNFEQDLGLPGLRVSKKSWQPVELLKKYKIRFR